MISKFHLSVQNYTAHKIRVICEGGTKRYWYKWRENWICFRLRVSSAGHNFPLFVGSPSVCIVRAVSGWGGREGPPTNVRAELVVINRGFEWEGVPCSIYLQLRSCVLPHTVPGITKFTVLLQLPWWMPKQVIVISHVFWENIGHTKKLCK
jgi:hypothetical protein